MPSLPLVLLLLLVVVLLTAPQLALSDEAVSGSGEEDGYYDDSAYYDEGEGAQGEGAGGGDSPPASSESDEERLRQLEEEMERKRMDLLLEQERREREAQEEAARIEAARAVKTTYKKTVGGGLGRVAVILATERFVNLTATQFGCVLQSQLGIKQQSKNATKVQRTMQENAKRQQEQFGKVVLESTISPDGGEDSASSSSTSSSSQKSSGAKEKKLTYRELQEQKREKRHQAELEKEALKGKFLLGASCETLICGSCKAMVEEFASAVVEGMRDPQYVYIEDLMPEFCKRKEVAMKYSELVGSVCFAIQSDKGGYRDAFLLPFEADDDWANVRLSSVKLAEKKKKICGPAAIGACSAQQFELSLKPAKLEQEHWDHKCYVCQAFARDLEERVQLSRGVTETNILGVVGDTCNRLDLPTAALRELCAPLGEGKLLDDVAWIAKVHSEALLRQVRGEVSFADKLCEEVSFCEKYVDPEELKRQQEAKMEQVFF